MRKIWIIIIMLVVNLFYYRGFWREFVHDTPSVEARYGEVLAVEMSVEQVYQNIIAHKSPFALRTDEFYPFGTSFTTTDPGNGFYFVLLRPFLSTHQSMLLVSLFSIFMAGLGMYLLLRLLKIQRPLALILGLAFGYTTFLLPRAGHLTYFSIYVFPWFFASAYQGLHASRRYLRLAGAIAAAVFLSLALYHNSYYFVTLGLAVAYLTSYYLLYLRHDLLIYLRTRYFELLVFLGATLVCLLPWIRQVQQDRLFEGLPLTKGWGGAILYSSDLLGYVIPSPYSRYLSFAATWMDAHFVFARGIFESYSYPGLLFLGTFGVLGYLVWRKRLPRSILHTITPLLFTTFWVWILTLGPFLHVAGKWALGLPDEIKLVVPLPFALFHYLPFMANIRSPARLTIGFVFVGYIVVAYLWQWAWRIMSRGKQILFLSFLVIIFIIDHSLTYTPALPTTLPLAEYQIIKADPVFGTVLEIPSTIRDGFTYFGSGDDLHFIAGQMIHGKPIIGGYLGRVAAYKIQYAQNNPFLGYVGRLTDPDIAHNGGLDRTTLSSWETIDVEASIKAIDLLDLRYVILQNQAPYTATMSAVLHELGYGRVQDNAKTSLWSRVSSPREFTHITIGEKGDDFMLAGNWYGRDQGFRWMHAGAYILFKVSTSRNVTLHLTGKSYYRPQVATIYLNRKFLGTIALNVAEGNYSLPVSADLLSPGLAMVYISTPAAYQPIHVDPHSTDSNLLSASFSQASLE